MVKKAAEPRKSASTGSGARAKPKADAKTEAKAGSAKQAKRAGRGPAEPLTVNQYDVLTEYVKWRYPRAPEKRTKGAKMPASLRPRVKAAFRTVKNFNSNVKDLYRLEKGDTPELDRLARAAPLPGNELRKLPVMRPADMIQWTRDHHMDGPKCLTLQQMVERFDAVFWSPAPRKLVQEAMLAMDCANCGKAPVLRKPKYIRWQHILAYGVFQHIQIDLVQFVKKEHLGLAEGHGMRYFMSVIDVFSKYSWTVPLKQKSADGVLDGLLEIFALTGLPKTLQCDNGTEFKGVVSEYLRKNDVQLRHGAPYSPNVQGQVERYNRTIKRHTIEYMQKYDLSRNWPEALRLATEYYNFYRKHQTLRDVPANVYLGRELRMPPQKVPALAASSSSQQQQQQQQQLGEHKAGGAVAKGGLVMAEWFNGVELDDSERKLAEQEAGDEADAEAESVEDELVVQRVQAVADYGREAASAGSEGAQLLDAESKNSRDNSLARAHETALLATDSDAEDSAAASSFNDVSSARLVRFLLVLNNERNMAKWNAHELTLDPTLSLFKVGHGVWFDRPTKLPALPDRVSGTIERVFVATSMADVKYTNEHSVPTIIKLALSRLYTDVSTASEAKADADSDSKGLPSLFSCSEFISNPSPSEFKDLLWTAEATLLRWFSKRHIPALRQWFNSTLPAPFDCVLVAPYNVMAVAFEVFDELFLAAMMLTLTPSATESTDLVLHSRLDRARGLIRTLHDGAKIKFWPALILLWRIVRSPDKEGGHRLMSRALLAMEAAGAHSCLRCLFTNATPCSHGCCVQQLLYLGRARGALTHDDGYWRVSPRVQQAPSAELSPDAPWPADSPRPPTLVTWDKLLSIRFPVVYSNVRHFYRVTAQQGDYSIFKHLAECVGIEAGAKALRVKLAAFVNQRSTTAWLQSMFRDTKSALDGKTPAASADLVLKPNHSLSRFMLHVFCLCEHVDVFVVSPVWDGAPLPADQLRRHHAKWRVASSEVLSEQKTPPKKLLLAHLSRLNPLTSSARDFYASTSFIQLEPQNDGAQAAAGGSEATEREDKSQKPSGSKRAREESADASEESAPKTARRAGSSDVADSRGRSSAQAGRASAEAAGASAASSSSGSSSGSSSASSAARSASKASAAPTARSSGVGLPFGKGGAAFMDESD